MPSANVNGIDLYYESHGEGDAAFVFAHGAGGNHLSWWNQVPAFVERGRVVTFDHRAFGQSLDTTGAGAAAFVDDLAGLLDHLKIPRATLIAQSMGGRSAMGFTLRHPERVKALVMADTVLGIRELVLANMGGAARAQMEETRRQRATTNAPTNTWALGPKYRQRNPAGAFLYQQIADLNPPRDTSFLAVAEPEVTTDQLQSLAVPILWLVGEDDALMPPAMMRAAHQLTPSSRLVVVPECGHSVYFEAPQAFNAAVMDFLGITTG
ncbi:MAG: alpha/beta fold hydrolase [Dehalococcoidia bacterium]